MDRCGVVRRLIMKRTAVVWIGVLALLPGCSKSAIPEPPVTETIEPKPGVVSPQPSAPVPSALPTPVVKKRSAESLRERIRKTVERMQADAEPRKRRQSFVRVAEALLNYEKAHGQSDDASDASGLSWRVRLLPFLGEEALYREFHLEEPYNSPHNQTLVSRMPAVYGDDALGLTRLHRLTMNEGILLVEVPEETASFWTKPVDLADDSNAIPIRIALRNGTCYTVRPTVSVAEWRAWRQLSTRDALPDWLEPIAAPSDSPTVIVDSMAAREQTQPTTWSMPPGTWCVVSLQPRRLLSHPLYDELFRELTAPAAETPAPAEARFGSYVTWVRNAVAWLALHKLRLDQLESLTVVVPSTIFRGPVNAAEIFAVIGRAAGLFDVEALITAEMVSTDGFQYREQGTTTGIVDLKHSVALHFAKDDTLLLGGQSLLVQLSEARDDDSRLTSWLRQAASAPLAVVIDAEPVQRLLKQQPVSFPPPIQELLPYVMAAQGLIVAMDPDADTIATLTIPFQQPSSAVGLHTWLTKQIDAQRSRLTMRASNENDITTDWWSALISGLQMRVESESLRVMIARPKNWDELLHSLLKVAQ